ncbi:MAG: 50S ribosomal protein L4 [Armatimonadota bacterium]|nr:50S ribosomal protein L4 [Armatimonadota bacterium]
MAQTTVYNLSGEEVSQIELDDTVFNIEPNEAVMHEAVVAHLRNCRQGTSSVKGRSDVRGGGKKPWRQKGTGHARQGSTRSPQWRHGGIVHGPNPRDLHRNVPDKVSKLARRSALSAKLADGELRVVERFAADEVKTRVMVEALGALGRGPEESTLVVLPLNREDRDGARRLYLSCRNIPNVTVCSTENLSAYDIIRNLHVLVDQAAIPRIVEVLRP